MPVGSYQNYLVLSNYRLAASISVSETKHNLASGLSIVQTTPIGSISSIESVSTYYLQSTAISYSPRRRRGRHDVSSLLPIVQAGYLRERQTSFESCL